MTVQASLKVLILMSIVMSSFGYFFMIPAELGKSKDHDGYCFYEQTQALVKKGESILLKTCEEISCLDDYSMTVSGCGTFNIQDPSCRKFERDFSKPYPDCCNNFICVESAHKAVDLNTDEKNSLD